MATKYDAIDPAFDPGVASAHEQGCKDGEAAVRKVLESLLLDDEFVRKLADAIMNTPLPPVTLATWVYKPEEHRA